MLLSIKVIFSTMNSIFWRRDMFSLGQNTPFVWFWLLLWLVSYCLSVLLFPHSNRFLSQIVVLKFLTYRNVLIIHQKWPSQSLQPFLLEILLEKTQNNFCSVLIGFWDFDTNWSDSLTVVFFFFFLWSFFLVFSGTICLRASNNSLISAIFVLMKTGGSRNLFRFGNPTSCTIS